MYLFTIYIPCEESNQETQKNLSQKPGIKKTKKSKEFQKSVTQLTDKGAKNGTLVSKGEQEWEKNSSL